MHALGKVGTVRGSRDSENHTILHIIMIQLSFQAIDRELTKRRQVIEMLTHAGKYYDSLLGEANIVATVRKSNQT